MSLSYYSKVIMPGNCIESSEKENERRLADSLAETDKIIDDISNRKVNYTSENILPESDFVENSYFYKRLKLMKTFYVKKNCIGCGLCAGLCPTHCIEIVNGKAKHVDKLNCTACYRCFHLCPQNAVRLLMPVRSQKFQYKHPDIKVNEIK